MFSPEFGDDAVRWVIDSSRPIASVARELQIGGDSQFSPRLADVVCSQHRRRRDHIAIQCKFYAPGRTGRRLTRVGGLGEVTPSADLSNPLAVRLDYASCNPNDKYHRRGCPRPYDQEHPGADDPNDDSQVKLSGLGFGVTKLRHTNRVSVELGHRQVP